MVPVLVCNAERGLESIRPRVSRSHGAATRDTVTILTTARIYLADMVGIEAQPGKINSYCRTVSCNWRGKHQDIATPKLSLHPHCDAQLQPKDLDQNMK